MEDNKAPQRLLFTVTLVVSVASQTHGPLNRATTNCRPNMCRLSCRPRPLSWPSRSLSTFMPSKPSKPAESIVELSWQEVDMRSTWFVKNTTP